MANLNKVFLAGRLGGVPKWDDTKGEKGLCTFSIAVTKEGKYGGEAIWFDVAVWGPKGKACADHLDKGSSVLVEGSLNDPFVSNTGKVYQKVTAFGVTFLDSKGAKPEYKQEVVEPMPEPRLKNVQVVETEVTTDDLPF